jgi:hypothetical protein
VVPGAFGGHGSTFRTSPRRIPPNAGSTGSRRPENLAIWPDGTSFWTTTTAIFCPNAAAQIDLLPSGAITSTKGIPEGIFGIRLICNAESQHFQQGFSPPQGRDLIPPPSRYIDDRFGELVGVPRAFGGYFGASGLLGQYLDLVKIQFLASASVAKSPM